MTEDDKKEEEKIFQENFSFSSEPQILFSEKKRFSDRVEEFFEYSKKRFEEIEKHKKVLLPVFLGFLIMGALGILEGKSTFVSASLSFFANLLHP